MTESNDSHPLTWLCTVCRFPIADHAGSIFIPYEDIPRRPDQEAEWSIAHFACDPRDGYSVEVSRIRTHKQALWWTSHLMGKRWVSLTDWDEIVERVSA